MGILYNIRIIKIILILPVFIFSGCVSSDYGKLENKIAEIMARPGGHIDPLPEVGIYEIYVYESGNLEARDPFRLFYEKEPTILEEESDNNGLTAEMEREIKNRNREELENFELDSLRMVGTLENTDNYWAIILDPDGIVHRVSVGNYMGLHIGKIVNIYENRIELREIVQDNSGRWEEREAALSLIEE